MKSKHIHIFPLILGSLILLLDLTMWGILASNCSGATETCTQSQNQILTYFFPAAQWLKSIYLSFELGTNYWQTLSLFGGIMHFIEAYLVGMMLLHLNKTLHAPHPSIRITKAKRTLRASRNTAHYQHRQLRRNTSS